MVEKQKNNGNKNNKQEEILKNENAELKKGLIEEKMAFQQENKELREKIAKLEEMIERLTETYLKSEKLQPAVEEYSFEDYPEIPTNKPIRVMSLFTGGLNLKTSNDGNAQVFRLEKFGDIIPIMYMDLSKIISNQRRFFEEGYCIVMDKDVVKLHYLEDAMKKILDYKTITNILNYDIEKIKTLFSGATKVIQQTIVDLLIEKINKGEHLDKNKISVISEIFGHDIYELANRVK